VIAEVKERLPLSRFDVERFILKKLSEWEVMKYHINI
jgi:hypothetical protein